MSNIELYSSADTNKEEGFYDAFPVGNGRIGAMIYGDPLNEKIPLNDSAMWLKEDYSKRYPDNFYNNYKNVQNLLLNEKIDEAHSEALKLFPEPKKMGVYTVSGFLNIKLNKEKISDYKRTLDLNNGVVRINYLYNDIKVQRTIFCSHKDDILVLDFKSEKDITYNISLSNLLDNDVVIKDNYIILTTSYNKSNKCIVSLKIVGAKVINKENYLEVTSSNFTIYINISCDTLFELKDPYNYLRSINKDFLYYLKNHQEDYHKLFNKVKFETSDSLLNRVYDLSRYLMISSSRDFLPANLQGLWNNLVYPRWDSKFTININLEMNYWNVLSDNLLECSYPLINLLVRLNKNGKEIAKLYHAKGSCAHHNTDIFADCYMVDHYMPATIWPLGNLWLSTFIYEYYIYTKDLDFLRKYKYLMEDALDFVESILVLDKDGYLIISPSLSPENSYLYNDKKYSLCNGCTMDDELIKDMIFKVKKSNMALGMNNDKYDYILSKLHPYNITKNNTIFEWHQDFIENEPGHRHLSHMYSLYPGEEIDFKSKLAPYFYNTIERRLENGSGQTGWSKAWITCLVARLHKEKETYKLFKEWIKNSTSKSLLDLHPPFQIDGNFGIATAIRLMFFESREDGLELLPSLGTYLKYYKLSNFRLKNDLMLDLEYQNKYLEFNIISNVEMDYLIYFKDKEFKIKLKKGDNYYYFDLNKKEIEILTD